MLGIMQVDSNLLPYQSDLRLSVNRSTTYVWDPIRRKNIVVLPEEMVRQLLVRYLLTELAYPKNRLRVEVLIGCIVCSVVVVVVVCLVCSVLIGCIVCSVVVVVVVVVCLVC